MSDVTWEEVYETFKEIVSNLREGPCVSEPCSVAFLIADDMVDKLGETGQPWRV